MFILATKDISDLLKPGDRGSIFLLGGADLARVDINLVEIKFVFTFICNGNQMEFAPWVYEEKFFNTVQL